MKKKPYDYITQLKKTLRSGDYAVVHSHKATRGTVFLLLAKKYGVKNRLVHSHIAASTDKTFSAKFFTAVSVRISKALSTQLFSCGKDAGKFMWGTESFDHGKVRVMHNAIDTEKFTFSEKLRIEKRRELGIADQTVFATVGRLTRQKNQEYLLRIFAKALGTRKDIVLLLIGRGEDERKLKNLAGQLEISKYVKFLGIRDDVSQLLNAIDVFLLPSLYEGLPVVLVEAQANGLKSIVSDRVTKEVDVTDLITYLPILPDTERDWAKAIVDEKGKSADCRSKYSRIIADAGYDIKTESKKMQDYYLSLCK